MNKTKIAIVHEWLVDYSGSERVIEQLINLFPQADVFALINFLPSDLTWFIQHKPVKTSFIQKLPWAKSKYRNYLPFMPLAVEQLDVSAYDIILSSSHAVAKGIITQAGQLHICYCHSPIRYAWDLYHQYLRESGLTNGIKGFFAKLILHYIRLWDFTTANRVDHFLANSAYVARRIERVYRRKATVIYPPVQMDLFTLQSLKENFFLTASRMVPYKKIDLIVDAFSQMPDKMLVIIGDGPDWKKIQVKATPNVQLMGYQPLDILKEYMQKAKAFVFAAEEDFGITVVEAQACGTPVIAFGKGGALETVIDGQTGLFFSEQTAESVCEAIHRFEGMADTFDPYLIRKQAEKFGTEVFLKKMSQFVHEKYELFREANKAHYLV